MDLRPKRLKIPWKKKRNYGTKPMSDNFEVCRNASRRRRRWPIIASDTREFWVAGNLLELARAIEEAKEDRIRAAHFAGVAHSHASARGLRAD